MEVSKVKRRCQNRGGFATAGPSSDETWFTGGAASGMRGGLSLPKRRLSGTWEPETPMRTEKPRVAEPQGREYGSGDSGAEQRVVAEKSPMRGARPWHRASSAGCDERGTLLRRSDAPLLPG